MPLPPPSSPASSCPIVSEPDDQGYVYFNREQTIPKLQDHLLVSKIQLDAIIADVDHVLQRPSSAPLCRPHTRIRGRGICADVREIALDVQQRHANNCGFASHPDVRLLQCSLWDIVKKRITLVKHTTVKNNSMQGYTSPSLLYSGDVSVRKDVTPPRQKCTPEEGSPTPSKKPKILLPTSTPMSCSSPHNAPEMANHLQSQAVTFGNCTTRVTGSRIASEYHAPLTRCLLQMTNTHTALKAGDFNYDKFLLDLQRYIDFDPACEALQYRTPYEGFVYVRNHIEWHCAISEMVSAGKAILDFEIVRPVLGFTPINRVMPRYNARPLPNLVRSVREETSKWRAIFLSCDYCCWF